MTEAETTPAPPEPTLTQRLRAVGEHPTAVGFALFLAVTLVWLGPLLPNFGNAVLQGPSDTTNILRMYWAVEQDDATPFTWSHDRLNGAPEGVPRPAAPEFVSPLQSAFVWSLKPLFGRVATVNLFIALGFLLTACATFLLLSRFGFGFLPSLFGGYVVAFNPWMFERAFTGALAFLHAWVFVLLLYALVRLREHRSLWRAVVAGAAYGLTFSLAAYMGLLATAIVAAFALVDLVKATSLADRLWTASLLSTMALVTGLFLAPGAIAFLQDRSDVTRALTNPLDQLDRLAASPSSYLLPSPRHPVLGDLGAGLRPEGAIHEKILYFGFVTMVLAVIGAFLLRRAQGRVRELLLLAAVAAPVALIASLPRTFDVLGVGVPTPAYVMGELTSFYRVYARFGYVFGFGIAILAAWALAQLPRTLRGRAAGVAALGAVAFELLVGAVPTWRIDAAPDYDRWLARQPPGIVAHYPVPMDKPQALALAHKVIAFQPISRQPLYTIFSAGTGGTREDGIRIVSRHLANEMTPRILAAEGVRYVVVHDDVYRAQGERLPRIPRTLELLETFGDVRVYRVTARPADVEAELRRRAEEVALLQGLRPATLAFADGFHDPEEFRPNEEWRWAIQAGRLRIENPNPLSTRFRIEGLAFSFKATRRVELTDETGETLASTVVQSYLRPFTLGPFRLPRGENVLALRVSPGPAPLGDNETKRGSVYLSPLTVDPLPDYANTLRQD